MVGTVVSVGSMGKRRGRRTRSDERGGRTDIHRGVSFGVPNGGPLARLGNLFGPRPDMPWAERSRLYRQTLPYIAVGAIALLGLIAVVVILTKL